MDKSVEYTGRSVDLTPTWEGILPGLLAAFENGSVESRKMVEGELRRMARIADLHVAASKGASAPPHQVVDSLKAAAGAGR